MTEAQRTFDRVDAAMDSVKQYRSAAMDLLDRYEGMGEEYADQYRLAAAVYGHMYDAYRHLQCVAEELDHAIRKLKGN